MGEGDIPNQSLEQIRERLRRVSYPGYTRDIVSFGFVRRIDLDDGRVTVWFAPNTRREDKVEQMVRAIKEELGGLDGVTEVSIQLERPFEEVAVGAPLTPLQAELMEDGVTPQADPMAETLARPDLAPDAGYGEEGPNPLGVGVNRDDIAESQTYDGPLPVFQWEIDPQDPSQENRERYLRLDDWEFRIWWQVHPAGLVYATIQALRDDKKADSHRRRHPMGRNVVVNLVYDERRRGITAIYGTAPDFRPFVEAFRISYGVSEDESDRDDSAESRDEWSKANEQS